MNIVHATCVDARKGRFRLDGMPDPIDVYTDPWGAVNGNRVLLGICPDVGGWLVLQVILPVADFQLVRALCPGVSGLRASASVEDILRTNAKDPDTALRALDLVRGGVDTHRAIQIAESLTAWPRPYAWAGLFPDGGSLHLCDRIERAIGRVRDTESIALRDEARYYYALRAAQRHRGHSGLPRRAGEQANTLKLVCEERGLVFTPETLDDEHTIARFARTLRDSTPDVPCGFYIVAGSTGTRKTSWANTRFPNALRTSALCGGGWPRCAPGTTSTPEIIVDQADQLGCSELAHLIRDHRPRCIILVGNPDYTRARAGDHGDPLIDLIKSRACHIQHCRACSAAPPLQQGIRDVANGIKLNLKQRVVAPGMDSIVSDVLQAVSRPEKPPVDYILANPAMTHAIRAHAPPLCRDARVVSSRGGFGVILHAGEHPDELHTVKWTWHPQLGAGSVHPVTSYEISRANVRMLSEGWAPGSVHSACAVLTGHPDETRAWLCTVLALASHNAYVIVSDIAHLSRCLDRAPVARHTRLVERLCD